MSILNLTIFPVTVQTALVDTCSLVCRVTRILSLLAVAISMYVYLSCKFEVRLMAGRTPWKQSWNLLRLPHHTCCHMKLRYIGQVRLLQCKTSYSLQLQSTLDRDAVAFLSTYCTLASSGVVLLTELCRAVLDKRCS